MRLTSIEFSFDPCNFYRDVPRDVAGYLADARSVSDSHPFCSHANGSPVSIALIRL